MGVKEAEGKEVVGRRVGVREEEKELFALLAGHAGRGPGAANLYGYLLHSLLRVRLPVEMRVLTLYTTTDRTLPNPFIWHRDPMISTWRFYGYTGYIPRRCATLVWYRAFNEAVDQHDVDSRIGTHTKRWSVNFPDEGTVDVVLNPGPQMTWRMLAEGIGGAEMVISTRVEFKFMVFVDDVEMGYGSTTKRKSLAIGATSKGRRSRLALPAGLPASGLGMTNLYASKRLKDRSSCLLSGC